MQAFIVVLLKNPNTGTIILCPHLTTPQGCNPFFMALSQGLGEWDGGGAGWQTLALCHCKTAVMCCAKTLVVQNPGSNKEIEKYMQ